METKQEIWKDIDGAPGYQVSNLGRVRSMKTGKENILAQRTVGSGYLQVHFKKLTKKISTLVHRLVATAFIPNPDGKSQVNHKNEIKTDNRVENLEWATNKENHNWGTGHQRGGLKHRGMHFYNDGVRMIQAFSCPVGFTKGMLRKK